MSARLLNFCIIVSSMPNIEERFREAFEALRPSARVVLGVSGGVDSMALLALLEGAGPKPFIAHFNHQLRGAESDGDEAFVRAEAEKRGLDFRVGRGDVRAHAKGVSIEMAARKLRHAFLAQVAREIQGDILLAHHADDQIELVIMRGQRGIEGYGAAGMREEARSSADPAIRILRPLLHFRKAELQQFVQERKIPFREDSSNAQLDADRNRVRHVLLPQMRAKFGPNIDEQLLRQIAQVRAREDSMRHVAKSWGEAGFDKLSDRTKADVIVLQLEQAGIPVTGGRINSLLRFPDKPLMIRPGVTVIVNAEGKLQIREEVLPPVPVWVNLRESADHCAKFNGGMLRWGFKLHWREIYKLPGVGMMLDSTRVGDWALLRHPQDGDSVRLSGRASARPLMDVLARNKIPREKRDRVVLATTQKGEIFWVEGLRIVEDFKLTEKTYDALQWQWTRDYTP